jgi:hypothetical protein
LTKYPMDNLVLDTAFSLLGEIIPQVRAVTVALDRTFITVYFIYDGYLDEDQLEELDCGTDELWNRCPTDYRIDSKMIRVDYPNPIPILGKLVYLRKEPLSS